jgi:enoyl-CoA hydratase/carnithine racemase
LPFDGLPAKLVEEARTRAEEVGKQVEAALAIAQRIAAQAPLAVQETLASCRLAYEESEAAANAELLHSARRLMKTEDAAEGVKSFLERRAAVFAGR